MSPLLLRLPVAVMKLQEDKWFRSATQEVSTGFSDIKLKPPLIKPIMTKLISAGIAGIAILSTAFAIALASSASASAQVYGGGCGYNNGVPNGCSF